MKDIVYSTVMKSYRRCKRIIPLSPIIAIICDTIILTPLGILCASSSIPELMLVWVATIFLLAIISSIIVEHFFDILDTYKNFFEYSKYYYQKQSFKALKKKIRKNKKYLI